MPTDAQSSTTASQNLQQSEFAEIVAHQIQMVAADEDISPLGHGNVGSQAETSSPDDSDSDDEDADTGRWKPKRLSDI